MPDRYRGGSFCTPRNPATTATAYVGSLLALLFVMNDEKGATEDKMEKIKVIRGSEVLGYEGSGREEHSGENSPRQPKELTSELADNKPEDLK
jgi:hypothetical protein